MAATKASNYQALKLLLDVCHINPNTPDSKGFCPLHIAVLSQNILLTSFLLDHGADPNVSSVFVCFFVFLFLCHLF